MNAFERLCVYIISRSQRLSLSLPSKARYANSLRYGQLRIPFSPLCSLELHTYLHTDYSLAANPTMTGGDVSQWNLIWVNFSAEFGR